MGGGRGGRFWKEFISTSKEEEPRISKDAKQGQLQKSFDKPSDETILKVDPNPNQKAEPRHWHPPTPGDVIFTNESILVISLRRGWSGACPWLLSQTQFSSRTPETTHGKIIHPAARHDWARRAWGKLLIKPRPDRRCPLPPCPLYTWAHISLDFLYT